MLKRNSPCSGVRPQELSARSFYISRVKGRAAITALYYLGVFVFVLYLCCHYTEVPDLKIISARLLCCIPNPRLTLGGSFLGIELLGFSFRS